MFKKSVLVMIFVLSGFSASAKVVSLDAAFHKALSQSENDKSNSQVSITLDQSRREAAWNDNSKKTIQIEGTGRVDDLMDTPQTAKADTFSDSEAERLLQQELNRAN